MHGPPLCLFAHGSTDPAWFDPVVAFSFSNGLFFLLVSSVENFATERRRSNPWLQFRDEIFISLDTVEIKVW